MSCHAAAIVSPPPNGASGPPRKRIPVGPHLLGGIYTDSRNMAGSSRTYLTKEQYRAPLCSPGLPA